MFKIIFIACSGLTEKHRLRVFENRLVRRLFGSKRKWLEAGENCLMRSEYIQYLVRKFEGKIPLGSPRRRWEDNI
jgi:hypothetical protein